MKKQNIGVTIALIIVVLLIIIVAIEHCSTLRHMSNGKTETYKAVHIDSVK